MGVSLILILSCSWTSEITDQPLPSCASLIKTCFLSSKSSDWLCDIYSSGVTGLVMRTGNVTSCSLKTKTSTHKKLTLENLNAVKQINVEKFRIRMHGPISVFLFRLNLSAFDCRYFAQSLILHCTHVISTGSYWQPASHAYSGDFPALTGFTVSFSA